MADGMGGLRPGAEAAGRPPPVGRAAFTGRLSALRIATVLLPLLSLSAIGWRSWQAVEAEARDRVERATDMLLEHARRAFETQEVAIAAVEQRIRGMDWSAIARSRDIHQFLCALDAVAPASGSVGLVDPSGRLAASSAFPFPNRPIDLSMRDYVRANPAGSGSREAPFVGEVIARRPNGVPVFPVARPRRAEDGLGDGGVVVATLLPYYFESFYQSVLETPGDAVTLARLDGVVLAAAPSPAQPEGAVLPGAAAPLLHQLRDHPVSFRRAVFAPDGAERLTAFRRLPGLEVVVAYGLAPDALRREWLQRMAGPTAGVVVAMLLLGTLTLQAERALRARAAAEAHARRAERQATLGLLAGGLAHDFGNISQSVLAASHLLRKHAETPERVRVVAQHLGRHAERAAALSRRMLETTRRSGTTPAIQATAVDVSEALRELAELLDATLGAGIRVRYEGPPSLLGRGFDRAELETALINLGANARDAMPRGGAVRLKAERVELTPMLANALALPVGDYLRISVIDTGEGMDEETLRRFGEAFFTTKPVGRGTGLGVAMVAAFARRAGGTLRAESKPGEGSTVMVYVPAA